MTFQFSDQKTAIAYRNDMRKLGYVSLAYPERGYYTVTVFPKH